MNKAKLHEKIRRNHVGVRFSDLCRLAEAFGFGLNRQNGSHAFYANPDIRVTLNFQNKNGMAKPYQVRQLLDTIDRYSLNLED